MKSSDKAVSVEKQEVFQSVRDGNSAGLLHRMKTPVQSKPMLKNLNSGGS